MNLTRKCNIVHLVGNVLVLSSGEQLSQLDVGRHNYVVLNSLLKPDIRFLSFLCRSAALTAGVSEIRVNSAKLRRVVDRVRRHTCGLVTYSDMRTLLKRDGL